MILLEFTAMLTAPKGPIPFIGVYGIAYCYLDNDFAGKQAQDTLDLLMPGRIHDISTSFKPYKDLNESLVQKGFTRAEA